MRSQDSGVADVAIIGGGISGCAAAHELTRRGLQVILLEKDQIGFEASSRNMGAIGSLGKFATDLAAMSVQGWQSLHNELGDSMELLQGGRLCIAHSDEDIPWLRRMQDKAAAQGVAIEWLDAGGVADRFPELGGNIVAAVFCPGDGTVNPMAVMQAYRPLLQKAGVKLLEGTMVRGIEVAKGRVTGVRTENGTITARSVFCAGGIWALRLLEPLGLYLPLQTLSVIHAETEPLPHLFDYFLRGPYYGMRQFRSGALRLSGGYRRMGPGHAVVPTDLRNLAVWAPRFRDNWFQMELVFDRKLFTAELFRLLNKGATPPRGLEPAIPEQKSRAKLTAAQKSLPLLSGAKFATVKGGLVDVTPDALPVLGPVKTVSGLHVALGFTGQGFGLGPVTGRLMADSIMGNPSPLLHRYRPERFIEEKLAPFPGLG